MSRDRDVDSFDRRAGSYECDWRAGFHQMVVARGAEVALDAVADPRDLLDVGCGTGGPLPLVQAVTSEVAGPVAGR
jgi:hypothetical protein